MSQIWIEVRQGSRHSLKSCLVLQTYRRNSLSKINKRFLTFFFFFFPPSKCGDFCIFFPKNPFVPMPMDYIFLWPRCKNSSKEEKKWLKSHFSAWNFAIFIKKNLLHISDFISQLIWHLVTNCFWKLWKILVLVV